MSIKEDVEHGVQEEQIREPLMLAEDKTMAVTDEEDGSANESSKGHPWMVYLSTFVAVCGSYEFGCCVSCLLSLHSYIRIIFGKGNIVLVLFLFCAKILV